MFLMHRNKIAAKLVMSATTIVGVHIENEKEMPIGVDTRQNLVLNSLQRWLRSRSIPQERQGISAVEKALGCSISEAALKAMCVSLTDCYWMREENSPLKWEDVNYHDNGFSEELFDVVLKNSEIKVSDFRLPDIFTDGAFEKTWVHSGGVPILLKRGMVEESKKNVLSANEVIVSMLAERLGFNNVKYVMANITSTGEKLCACPSFITNSNEEFVSAFQIENEKRVFGKDLYDLFVKWGFEREMKDMLYLDHLVRNVDRHEKNFGIICEADTGDILRMAPIYDSGSCLDWKGFEGTYRFDAKPFFDDRYEQLKLLSKKDIYKRHQLTCETIEMLIKETYEKFQIPEIFYDRAVKCVETSCGELDKIAKEYMQARGDDGR